LLKKLLLKNTSKFVSTKRFFTATTIATVKTNNITYELIDAYLFFAAWIFQLIKMGPLTYFILKNN